MTDYTTAHLDHAARRHISDAQSTLADTVPDLPALQHQLAVLECDQAADLARLALLGADSALDRHDHARAIELLEKAVDLLRGAAMTLPTCACGHPATCIVDVRYGGKLTGRLPVCDACRWRGDDLILTSDEFPALIAAGICWCELATKYHVYLPWCPKHGERNLAP
jgi:hypothetical protein